MQRRQINAVIDLALLVMFPIVCLTSVVLFFFLPSGGGGAGLGHAIADATNLKVFLGLTRSQWVDLHNITGLVFIVLTAIHIILHIPYYRIIRRCLSGSGSQKCDRE